ncbi:hypothetical protein D3C86_1845140 [compost metagenome]
MPPGGLGVVARGQLDVAQGGTRLGEELGLLDGLEQPQPFEQHRPRLVQVASEAQGLPKGTERGADPEPVAERPADLEGLAVPPLGLNGRTAPCCEIP